MSGPKNAMEIFKLLDGSNCRECGEKTCMAFAGAVYTGNRKAGGCPKLKPEDIVRLYGDTDNRESAGQYGDEYLAKLKNEIMKTDLSVAAQRIGSPFSNGRLTLKILGKEVAVDSLGNLFTDIHVNPWVVAPLFNYILYSQGLPVSGNWVSFRELKGGREHYPLFQKRCEMSMKELADTYTDLFDDLVHLFGGEKVKRQFKSDISVVLRPLPEIPMMICYWLPEDEFESSLNVFFDETADKNLDTDSVFNIGTGIAYMLRKLTLRHGFHQIVPSS